jgi:hypothetical protein
MLSMFIKPKATYLCARLGIADLLNPDGSDSKSAAELAKELKVRTATEARQGVEWKSACNNQKLYGSWFPAN